MRIEPKFTGLTVDPQSMRARGRLGRWLTALVWFAVFVGSAAGPTAAARHRHHGDSSVAGAFDYYLLSLSWSPAFCLQSPGAVECNGPRRYGFIVHGLWPQNEQGWPENCAPGSQVPDSVVRGIADLMPAPGLVRHEWTAHGTCSGLNPSDFFSLVRRAYQGVVIPARFADPTSAIELSPVAIAEEFRQSNPRLPAEAVIATCSGQGAPRLREVHVCLSRELVPRPCSADAVRAACGAASVLVPPIR